MHEFNNNLNLENITFIYSNFDILKKYDRAFLMGFFEELVFVNLFE